MRGLAVMAAALAGWVIGGGALPRIKPLPAPSLRSMGTAAAVWPVGFLLAVGLTGSAAIAVATGMLGAGAVLAAAAAKAHRHHARSEARWPDLLAVIRGRLGGGMSLPESLTEALLAAEGRFEEAGRDLDRRLRAGAPFEDAVRRLPEVLGPGVADQVAVSLSLAHRTGGARVGELVGALGRGVADELRLRDAHDAATTQQRLTAAVALVAPWLLLMLTVATNPSARAAYGTASGVTVIAVGFVATAVGYLVSQRIRRLADRPRVFR